MDLDPQGLAPAEIYRLMTALIVPRPIAWVSTRGPGGTDNLAPFSYFMGVGSRPPSLAFSCVNRRDGSPKDTLRNIQDTGEFVVNVVPFRLAEAMNESSEDAPHGVDEFVLAGLEKAYSVRVAPPGVAAAPARLECRLLQAVPVGEGPLAATVVLGEVVHLHVDDAVLRPGVGPASARLDPDLLDAVARMGGDLYARTRDRFALARPRPRGA